MGIQYRRKIGIHRNRNNRSEFPPTYNKIRILNLVHGVLCRWVLELDGFINLSKSGFHIGFRCIGIYLSLYTANKFLNKFMNVTASYVLQLADATDWFSGLFPKIYSNCSNNNNNNNRISCQKGKIFYLYLKMLNVRYTEIQ